MLGELVVHTGHPALLVLAAGTMDPSDLFEIHYMGTGAWCLVEAPNADQSQHLHRSGYEFEIDSSSVLAGNEFLPSLKTYIHL